MEHRYLAAVALLCQWHRSGTSCGRLQRSRHLLFVLLLGSAVALADDKPKTEQANGVGAAEKKTEAAHGATDHAHAKKELAHRQAEQAHAKTEPASKGLTSRGQRRKRHRDRLKPEAKPEREADLRPRCKALGMSILGNQDAPKSLVIVPWKT